MNPDDFKQAWKRQASQTRLAIDADLVLQEVRRNEQHFASAIFRRDAMELGTALVLLPVWVYLGIKLSLPWTWYLMMPALLWLAGFFVVERMRHKPRRPEPGEALRECARRSLLQVEHQIWLLRNIFWWYILPPIFPAAAFIGHVAWLTRSGGWATAARMSFVVAVVVAILASIYWINQRTVRTQLAPRRRELEALLASLEEEAPGAS